MHVKCKNYIEKMDYIYIYIKGTNAKNYCFKNYNDIKTFQLTILFHK